MKYNLFIFLHLLPVPLVLYPRNNCHIQSCELCVLSFLLRIYCLGLTFRPLIHSNFCKWCEVRVNSILLHMTIQFSQHHVLKRVLPPLNLAIKLFMLIVLMVTRWHESVNCTQG